MGFLLDVWGEGRIYTEIVTGFTESLNLNHIDQKISNGSHKGQPIPNLFPVYNYDNPQFPDEMFEYITLMGAPITQGTAEGMCKVLTNPNGKIYLYDPDVSSRRIFEGVAANFNIVFKQVVPLTSLRAPFNEITLRDIYVFGYYGHDEL